MYYQILAKRFGDIRSFPYLCTRNIKSSHLKIGLATHEDDVADAEEPVTKGLRDNGFESTAMLEDNN